MLVEFIHRLTKPELPVPGRFYWIYRDKNQIWFAPDEKPEDMLLLNDTFDGLEERLAEFETRIEKTEEDIEVIKVELDGLEENLKNELKEFINNQGYLTINDLNKYTTSYLQKNLKTVNGNELFGTGNIEIKTEVKIDDKTKQDIINQVKNEVETRPFKWTVID